MAQAPATYASFGTRFAATVLDAVIWSIISGIFMLVFFGYSGLESEAELGTDPLSFLVDEIIPGALTIFLWIKLCATPGKFLMGCRVVDATTFKALTPRQAVIRYLGYFVSLLPLGLGFFWVLFDKRRQGFHDKLANSVVVMEAWGGEVDDEGLKSLDQLISEMH